MAASPSSLPHLLPDNSRLRLDCIEQDDSAIQIVASVLGDAATCPACRKASRSIHSRYIRVLRDLPWQGAAVRLSLNTRRFYCRSAECRKKIFTERLHPMVDSYGRQTQRLAKVLQLIGHSLGGEAGLRLANRLGIQCSADTILRHLKSEACSGVATKVRVLGVDDWAWRKGQRYGTILVDLERHQPIDLLPDRNAETLRCWLQGHPEVEVIARDRAGAYAEGSRTGAPRAVQVADRFHMLCNLTQALHRLLERLSGALQRLRATEGRPSKELSQYLCSEPTTQQTSPVRGHPANRNQQLGQECRERRKARYEAVITAQQRGLSERAIAKEMGLSRMTVRRFLHSGDFPERSRRECQTALAPFRQYLQKRWSEGCHNAAQLWRELRQQGYRGQRTRVKEFVRAWRSPSPTSIKVPKQPSPRQLAVWLTKPLEQRKQQEQAWVQILTSAHPQIATAEHLAMTFRKLFRDRSSTPLEAWLTAARHSDIPELRGFAIGIERDKNAVVAAIELPWSNGQVEGQIHRLKFLKRQMYGRSGFLLLRRRILPFSLIHGLPAP
jgi:transposase